MQFKGDGWAEREVTKRHGFRNQWKESERLVRGGGVVTSRGRAAKPARMGRGIKEACSRPLPGRSSAGCRAPTACLGAQRRGRCSRSQRGDRRCQHRP
ncbi:hypothetical protein NDU88_007004 [Pleurodeles waltl]|uniref:Uncharacterized protein n=1 Tax=Pleurodeles waltl TaxID=8319 RepID=A0AAV7UNW3_PLEWA|nr:hypothetical protein NDU88_007004 [Pleurodeles waltl]